MINVGSRSLARTSALLERAAKAAFAFTAFAYVAGILVVNIYLVGLGFPSAEFTQTRYVLAGSLWSFVVGTSFAALRLTTEMMRQAAPPGKARWLRLMMALLTSGLALLVTAAGISFVTFGQSNNLIDTAGATTTLVGALTALVAAAAIKTLRKVQEKDSNSGRLSNPHLLIVLPFLTTAGVMLIAYYATYCYPRFSGAIGGGGTYEVLLAPAEGRETTIKKLRLEIRTDGLVGPCDVIFEDSSTYFLRVKSHGTERMIRISKALFEGAITTK